MTKIKVEASDLEIGMYVCELDRPWLESPFLFQGFLLESSEDVQDVANACEYVFVELANSSETVRSRLQSLASSQNSSTTVQETTPSNQANDDEGYAYKEHLYLARKIYDHTRSYIDKTLTAVGEGSREVDTEQAKSLVNEMIDNILVKPHAMAWLTHLKNRDEYTLTHSINVCILALTFGRHMQLPREQLEILGLGALLHDIGKLRVPPEILNKPDRLTREEFEIMKKHPVEGYNILREDLLMSPEILDIVLHHHVGHTVIVVWSADRAVGLYGRRVEGAVPGVEGVAAPGQHGHRFLVLLAVHADAKLLRVPGVLQLRKNFRFVTLPFGGRA
ncbi:MAG: DUF3391 domain-containing protein [Gammaproteobacteria bacterium]